jgi:hypothetical protein
MMATWWQGPAEEFAEVSRGLGTRREHHALPGWLPGDRRRRPRHRADQDDDHAARCRAWRPRRRCLHGPLLRLLRASAWSCSTCRTRSSPKSPGVSRITRRLRATRSSCATPTRPRIRSVSTCGCWRSSACAASSSRPCTAGRRRSRASGTGAPRWCCSIGRDRPGTARPRSTTGAAVSSRSRTCSPWATGASP